MKGFGVFSLKTGRQHNYFAKLACKFHLLSPGNILSLNHNNTMRPNSIDNLPSPHIIQFC